MHPVGEWNSALITSHGPKVSHWLNGRMILAYTRFTPEFAEAVARSKFRSVPDFGRLAEGHILLQHHGDEVAFRNLKIRVLHPSDETPLR